MNYEVLFFNLEMDTYNEEAEMAVCRVIVTKKVSLKSKKNLRLALL